MFAERYGRCPRKSSISEPMPSSSMSSMSSKSIRGEFAVQRPPSSRMNRRRRASGMPAPGVSAPVLVTASGTEKGVYQPGSIASSPASAASYAPSAASMPEASRVTRSGGTSPRTRRHPPFANPSVNASRPSSLAGTSTSSFAPVGSACTRSLRTEAGAGRRRQPSRRIRTRARSVRESGVCLFARVSRSIASCTLRSARR